MRLIVYDGIIPPPLREDRKVSVDCLVVRERGGYSIDHYRLNSNGVAKWDGDPSIFGKVLAWARLPDEGTFKNDKVWANG